jgi:hypothetical protein
MWILCPRLIDRVVARGRWIGDGSTLRLAALAVLIVQLVHAAPDGRFGFAGTGGRAFAQKYGVLYYSLEGNYQAGLGNVFSSVDPSSDPPSGFKVVRKVAKLNVRTDALGETNAEFLSRLESHATSLALWYTFHSGPKPQFAWYSPNPGALAAAESAQIVATVRREKQAMPQAAGTLWEIGNEPNLFPSLAPAEYGALFSRYYRVLKNEDPSAQVALGPFFLRESGEDILPRMREALTEKLVAKGLGAPGQPLFDSVRNDLWNTLSGRVLSMSTPAYVEQCLAVLDTSVRPDAVTLHVYPFDDRSPARLPGELADTLKSALDALDAAMASRSASPAYWITEFGNLVPGLTEAQVTAQASEAIDAFASEPRVRRWLLYKPTGADEQFVLIAAGAPPLTRLAKDSSFSPVDGSFSCDSLNAIGRMYYQRASGAPCEDAQASVSGASLRDVEARLEGTTLWLDLPSGRKGTVVSVQVLDASGATLGTIRRGNLGSGKQRIPLAEFLARPGVSIVEARIGEKRRTFHFVGLSPPGFR